MQMLNNKAVRKLMVALGLLMGTLTFGVVGFMALEGYSVVDSFYMTIITMSTVGFETLDGGLSTGGKIFVSFLIVSAIGVFLYVINTITTFVVEGEIQTIFKGYRVNKEINKLHDHVVVCGLGRNGHQAVLELAAEGIPFVVVEVDEDVIAKFVESHPNVLVYKGDATEEETLRAVNIAKAKGVISALADDASNVYVTLSIRQLNPTVPVVARAAVESTISKLKVAGATRVVLPNKLGGRKMARVLTRPALIDFIDLITGQGNFNMNLEEIDCMEGGEYLGKTLRELDIRSKTGALVLGSQYPDGHFELNPSADLKLVAGLKLFVIGKKESLDLFRKEFLT